MKWIIGGTSDARKFVEKIGDRKNYILSVATKTGVDFAGTDKVKVGRMTQDEMALFIKREGITAVFDLSHPFAHIVSENAKLAAQSQNIKYYRYKRSETNLPEGGILVDSLEECMELLKKLKGVFLFTTGSKNVPDFQKVRGDNRFIYRVLPTVESLKILEGENVELKDIIACLGPFTKEFDAVLLSELKADYCVMKDSGKGSGTYEKIEACKLTGAVPIIIKRKYEEGISDLDELLKIFMGE